MSCSRSSVCSKNDKDLWVNVEEKQSTRQDEERCSRDPLLRRMVGKELFSDLYGQQESQKHVYRASLHGKPYIFLLPLLDLILLSLLRPFVYRNTKTTSSNTQSSARPSATASSRSSSTTPFMAMTPHFSLSFVAPYPFFRMTRRQGPRPTLQ